MKYTKLAGTLIGFTLLTASANAVAASVVTVAYEISKNDEVTKSTNIMTFEGEKLRVDYLGRQGERTKTTPFLLTINNGKSWVLGDHDNEEYYCAKMNMNEFFNTIGDLITRIDSITNAKYSNTSVDQVLEEAGPEILGHQTAHIRIQSTAKIKARVLVKSYEYELKKVDDFWYARDIQIHPARQRWIEALTHSGYEHLDKLSQQIRGSVKGALLKEESVMHVTDVNKNKTDTFGRKITVTAVEEVKDAELAEDIFNKPECQDIKKDQVKDVAKGMFKEGKLSL
jgi:hypothetical protein